MGIMEGKVCVVTGGGGSIGLAAAQALLEEGARVLLVGRSPDKLALGGGVAQRRRRTCSIASRPTWPTPRTPRSTWTGRSSNWGNIDVIFSHAGIAGVIKPVTEYPEDVFDAVIATNIRGSFLACKYGLPLMNDGGSIIITSSIMGTRPTPASAPTRPPSTRSSAWPAWSRKKRRRATSG